MTSQKFSQNIFVPQGLLLSQAIEIANSTFSEICFANTLKLCEAAYVGFPSLSAVQAANRLGSSVPPLAAVPSRGSIRKSDDMSPEGRRDTQMLGFYNC
jgi:hypothetical protein